MITAFNCVVSIFTEGCTLDKELCLTIDCAKYGHSHCDVDTAHSNGRNLSITVQDTLLYPASGTIFNNVNMLY